MTDKRPKVLILGTGIAGASLALKFAQFADVKIVSKASRLDGSTRYAQGGIASVWSDQDSFDEHAKDTLRAGAGLCHEDIVDLCVHEGPQRVQELIELGVSFTKRQDSTIDPAAVLSTMYDLHQEGGHGKRRILHAADLTGLEIIKTLMKKVSQHPSIEIFENHVAVDLITEAKVSKWRRFSKRASGDCLGAYILNSQNGKITPFEADYTVLATGGAGKVYLYTSNPDIATGDGVAMAYRAGARVANLEFMQFHPTCLFHPEAKNFLISEALRGEGAVLKTISGEQFMKKYHEKESLAPRDIVARAIDSEMKKSGSTHVCLDATGLGAEFIKNHFPNIYDVCLGFGIDITMQPIPVVPAAHYLCGGVYVDENGLTTIPGLYAVGEVSCTGLHGANRLASNSLLEAVVFAHQVVEHVKKTWAEAKTASHPKLPETLPEWDSSRAVELEEQIDIAATWHEIRTLMWNYVGIVRSNHRLERASKRLQILQEEVNRYYWDYLLTPDLIELRNLVTVASLMVQCASYRKESRGLHYTVNYPERNDAIYSRDTVI